MKLAIAICGLLPAAPAVHAGPAGICLAVPDTAQPPAPRPLRFGITAAGQVFTSQPERVPEDPAATMAALDRLRGGEPFLVRLNRFFSRDGVAGIDQFEQLTRRYTDAGYQVTLQLRYGPPGTVLPSPEGFTAWVREVVARLGDDPGVVGLEVTNEPNLRTAPDNSDGAFAGVVDALAMGVIAATEERAARRYEQLTIGFNWFHDTGALNERGFWNALAAAGGTAFAGALDWVGLNAYPGTYDFAATPPGLEGREMLVALTKLRECYLPLIGVGHSTPIRVIENGFPDGFGREPLMADTLERMVRAVHDHAGTYNVTHYLWFTLRDTDSTALGFEQRYGLLQDDYTPKPALARYQDLIAELG